MSEIWRDCADRHPYINWRLRDGDDCFVCMLLEANAEMSHGLELFAGEVDGLRAALQSLYDATDAVLDNYHYEHRQGCGGVPGSTPGDSDYCSISDATKALAGAGVVLGGDNDGGD